MSMSSRSSCKAVSGSSVTIKVMKCFHKQNSINTRHFVECLSDMAVDVEEFSFLEYTQKWFNIGLLEEHVGNV